MKETVNYKLKKPELSDVVNIDDLNSNMDILDKEVKNIDTKKADVSDLDKKVDKVSGKGLSTNDYTNTDKSEVAKIKDKADKTDIKNKASISHASNTGTVTTEHSHQVNASARSIASGLHSQVNVSRNSTASGSVSQVNASEGSVASGWMSQVNASQNVNNNIPNSVAGGYGSDAPTKDNDYNVTWRLNSKEGEIYAKNDMKIGDFSLNNAKGSISSNDDIDEITTEHDKQINASTNVELSFGVGNQINASVDSKITDGGFNQLNTSSECSIVGGGSYNQIATSEHSTIGGLDKVSRSQILSTHGGVIQANSATIQSSTDSIIQDKHFNSQILSGRGVKTNDSYTITGGYSTQSTSTQNRAWEIDSFKGTIKAKDSITGNSSFADFAEYMESEDGKAIPFGTMVTLSEGQKIKVAKDGDIPVGVISATAGIILNAQGFEWADRYLYDRYGQPILVEQEVENPDGTIEVMDLPMINPDYDANKEYIPREDRPEWNVVGMKGQIYVNIDDTVEEGGYVKPTKHGIATRGIIVDEYDGIQATKMWKVMEITTPYEEELGHGIARIII